MLAQTSPSEIPVTEFRMANTSVVNFFEPSHAGPEPAGLGLGLLIRAGDLDRLLGLGLGLFGTGTGEGKLLGKRLRLREALGAALPLHCPQEDWQPNPQCAVVMPHQLYCEQHCPAGQQTPFPQTPPGC